MRYVILLGTSSQMNDRRISWQNFSTREGKRASIRRQRKMDAEAEVNRAVARVKELKCMIENPSLREKRRKRLESELKTLRRLLKKERAAQAERAAEKRRKIENARQAARAIQLSSQDDIEAVELVDVRELYSKRSKAEASYGRRIKAKRKRRRAAGRGQSLGHKHRHPRGMSHACPYGNLNRPISPFYFVGTGSFNAGVRSLFGTEYGSAPVKGSHRGASIVHGLMNDPSSNQDKKKRLEKIIEDGGVFCFQDSAGQLHDLEMHSTLASQGITEGTKIYVRLPLEAEGDPRKRDIQDLENRSPQTKKRARTGTSPPDVQSISSGSQSADKECEQ